jgi:acyl-CoA synthetase (AMP-forming)/AMP-acid ligase II
VCGEHRLTYRELEARANRAAHVLAAMGVGPGDHVGIYQYNGTEYVECMLGVLKLRAVPININYRYVDDELRYLFDNADLVACAYHEEFAERLRRVAPDLPALCIETDYEDALAASPASRNFAPRSDDDLFIIYTGGTTGFPKGVMWRHEDFFVAALGAGNPQGPPVTTLEGMAEQARTRGALVMFAIGPLMHGAGTLGTLIALNWGSTAVLVRKFDAHEVWRTVERERVNSMSIVGDAMARPLADALDHASHDLSSLFVISSAGAIFSEAVKEALRSRLPSVMLLDSFGATETGFQGMGTAESSPDKGLRFTMLEGAAVIDEDGCIAPPGVVGRLARRGHIPLGYYKDPEKTAQTFVEIDGVRWVVLGDMARAEPDGTISVLGRGAVCINSGGEKIFPEEVEAALKSHPDVFDAVVIGVPDERWMERVAAVVQPRPGARPTLGELDAHCRARIARYKVPRELVLVDEIVRSPVGKPDYPWARAVAMQGDVGGQSGGAAPRPRSDERREERRC